MLLIGSFEPWLKRILYTAYEFYISCLSKSRIGSPPPPMSWISNFTLTSWRNRVNVFVRMPCILISAELLPWLLFHLLSCFPNSCRLVVKSEGWGDSDWSVLHQYFVGEIEFFILHSIMRYIMTVPLTSHDVDGFVISNGDALTPPCKFPHRSST